MKHDRGRMLLLFEMWVECVSEPFTASRSISAFYCRQRRLNRTADSSGGAARHAVYVSYVSYISRARKDCF